MRLKLYILGKLLALAFLYVSCNGGGGQSEAVPKCSVFPETIESGNAGGEFELNVECEREWTAFSDDEWIECVVKMNNGLLLVKVEANDEYRIREGSVVVKAGVTRISIPVSQEAKQEAITDPDIVVPDGYRLIWNDEFEEGEEPSSDLWYYETGGHGWGNNELQTYVSGSVNGERLASVENGILTITAKKIEGTVYSIRMNTKQSWKYGYFEARLKLPSGKGTWPAFWMLPQNFTAWPDDGEIDIMEEVGYNPDVVVSSIHCAAYNHGLGTQKSGSVLLPSAQTEFHVYAMEWTKDFIRMLVDGEEIFRYVNDGKGSRNTWPFNAPFYIKLNLAWGGDWGGAQGVDESVLPATYQIDYVRVFEKK